MKLKHLQKLTLIDYPGEIACTLFLFGCSFRCGFCYNPELVLKEENPDIEEKEVLDFLAKRKKHLTGICITGGEPLMTLEKDFLLKIKEMGYKIKIDTNGSFPEKLVEFIEAGLVDYVAMDIKGERENYEKIANVKVSIDKIEESIKIISNLENYEFRTTIVEKFHTEENVLKMFKWLDSLFEGKIKNYSLQGFKNVGKFINDDFSEEKSTTKVFLDELEIMAKGYCDSVIVKY